MRYTLLTALAAASLLTAASPAIAQPMTCLTGWTGIPFLGIEGGTFTDEAGNPAPRCQVTKELYPGTGGPAPKAAAPVTPPVVDPVDPVDPTDPGEEEPVDPTDPEEPVTEVPSTPIETEGPSGPQPTEGTLIFDVPSVINLDATAGITNVAPGAYIVTNAVVDANAAALLGIPEGIYSGTVFNGKATIRLSPIGVAL